MHPTARTFLLAGAGLGLLLGAASCTKNQACDRNEDCGPQQLCVPNVHICIDYAPADLAGTGGEEDLAMPPAEDMAGGGDDGGGEDGGKDDGGTGARWLTGQAAAGTLGGSLLTPSGVCWSGTRLYVADSGHHRVLVYDKLDDKAAPIGAIGRADLTPGTLPVMPPTARSLSRPGGLWCNADTLLVADRDNNRVLVYSGQPTTNTAADAVVGQASLTLGGNNRGGMTSANSLSAPEDVFWDGARLYIADTGNYRVVGYAAATAQKLKELATGNAEVVFGQRNFTEKATTSSASETAIGRPLGVAVGGGRVAVVDGGFNRVMLYLVPATFMTGTALKADAALGQVNLGNKNPGVGPTKFTDPVTLRLGPSEFYVADRTNNRVLVFKGDLPGPGSFAEPASVALGQPKIGAPMTPVGDGPADLAAPGGVVAATVAGKSYIVVSDAGNNRVQIFRAR